MIAVMVTYCDTGCFSDYTDTDDGDNTEDEDDVDDHEKTTTTTPMLPRRQWSNFILTCIQLPYPCYCPKVTHDVCLSHVLSK